MTGPADGARWRESLAVPRPRVNPDLAPRCRMPAGHAGD